MSETAVTYRAELHVGEEAGHLKTRKKFRLPNWRRDWDRQRDRDRGHGRCREVRKWKHRQVAGFVEKEALELVRGHAGIAQLILESLADAGTALIATAPLFWSAPIMLRTRKSPRL